jgi:DNA-binding NarL/FixJ family response regulator
MTRQSVFCRCVPSTFSPANSTDPRSSRLRNMTEDIYSPAIEDGGMTVLIADSHPLIRHGLKWMLGTILKGAKVFETSDSTALLNVLEGHPDAQLAVVDSSMTVKGREDWLVGLAVRYPQLRLILMSTSISADLPRHFLQISSVFAVVSKTSDIERFRIAVEATVMGRRVGIIGLDSERRTPLLTSRQADVHQLLSRGLSNKLIADRLGISEGTVKNHLTDIFRLLNTTNRTQAAKLHP